MEGRPEEATRKLWGVELVGGQLLLQGGARVVIGENARRRALDDVAYGVPLAIAISLRGEVLLRIERGRHSG